MISRSWEAGVKAPDREAASATPDGLDAGRASATLLLSGNVRLDLKLHAYLKSMTEFALVGGPLFVGSFDCV